VVHGGILVPQDLICPMTDYHTPPRALPADQQNHISTPPSDDDHYHLPNSVCAQQLKRESVLGRRGWYHEKKLSETSYAYR